MNDLNKLGSRIHTFVGILFSLSAVNANANDIIDKQVFSIPLVAENSDPTVLTEYLGEPLLIYFGYTFCPDVCPLISANIGRALRKLNLSDEDLNIVFISVDPRRDTPEVLERYTDFFHKDIVGLTGDLQSLQELSEGFRTSFSFSLLENNAERAVDFSEYQLLEKNASYLVTHSSQIYLLAADGSLVDIIGYGSDANLIADKIRAALKSNS